MTAGPPLSTISLTSNSPQIVSLGVFASGSYAALRMRKEVDLLDICTSSLSKLPKIMSKVPMKLFTSVANTKILLNIVLLTIIMLRTIAG
jgi:hypothetical protein